MSLTDDLSTHTKFKRLLRYFGAMLYDSLLLLAVMFAASVIYLVPLYISSGVDNLNQQTQHQLLLSGPVYKSYVFFVWFIFLSWFWMRGGQTLGLTAWKLKIIELNQQPITLWHALLRFLSALFPWVVAFFIVFLTGKIFPEIGSAKYLLLILGFAGIFWSLIDKDGLMFHDKFSTTKIISIHQLVNRK